MVIMAGGMDHGRGRVRPTATTSRNMAAIQLIPSHAVLDIHIIFNWQLPYQEIRWPVSRGHITGLGLELIKVLYRFEVDRWPCAGLRSDCGLMSG